jgi:hypothetical protein
MWKAVPNASSDGSPTWRRLRCGTFAHPALFPVLRLEACNNEQHHLHRRFGRRGWGGFVICIALTQNVCPKRERWTHGSVARRLRNTGGGLIEIKTN